MSLAITRKIKSRWVRWLLVLSGIIVFILIMPIFVSLILYFSDPIQTIQEGIAANHAQFMVIRWGLLATLILLWPWMIKQLGRGDVRAEEFLAYWSRWRLLGWFLVIELMFVQGYLIEAISNLSYIVL